MLKIKDGFTLRHAGDTYFIISTLQKKPESPQIFSINESGALLWNELIKGTDKDNLLAAMQREYETDNVELLEDIEEFLKCLNAMGVLDGL